MHFETKKDAIARVWFRTRSAKRAFIGRTFMQNTRNFVDQFKIEHLTIKVNYDDEKRDIYIHKLKADMDKILFDD
jgi:hypothetical protein